MKLALVLVALSGMVMGQAVYFCPDHAKLVSECSPIQGGGTPADSPAKPPAAPVPLQLVPAKPQRYLAHKKGERGDWANADVFYGNDDYETRWTCSPDDLGPFTTGSGKHWCIVVHFRGQ
jgi:hypothetical protein